VGRQTFRSVLRRVLCVLPGRILLARCRAVDGPVGGGSVAHHLSVKVAVWLRSSSVAGSRTQAWSSV